MLQVAPTGFSAVIDPDGRVVQRTGIGERAVLVDTVEMRRGRTLASRVGRWPLVLYGVGTIGLAWGLEVRRRSRSTEDQAGTGPHGEAHP